jgi:hypothetical protein
LENISWNGNFTRGTLSGLFTMSHHHFEIPDRTPPMQIVIAARWRRGKIVISGEAVSLKREQGEGSALSLGHFFFIQNTRAVNVFYIDRIHHSY